MKPKFAIGQPLWSSKHSFAVRPIGRFIDITNDYVYLCVNYKGNEYRVWESELKPISYLKTKIRDYLYLVKGGRYEPRQFRAGTSPDAPTAA